MSNVLILSALLGVTTAICVIYLYRKQKLKEDHALFWLFISVVVVVLSTYQDLLTWINLLVQAGDPNDVVLASFIFMLILFSIYYSVKISELTDQNKRLAQEVALLYTNKREKKKIVEPSSNQDILSTSE
jgi:hypothetical protein